MLRVTVKLASSVKNCSIQLKLSLLIIFSCSLALIIAGGGFVGYQALQYRQTAVREGSALAEIIATNSTAALTFVDDRAEVQTLKALRGDPQQTQAAVYDEDEKLFASYQNPKVIMTPLPTRPRPDGAYFAKGSLLLFEPIRLGNLRIGTIMLTSSMNGAYTRLWNAVEIIVLLMAASLTIALLLDAKLQRAITSPLASLSHVARAVSAAKDYSVRAKKFGNDETGAVIDSFNDMLSEIESREKDLRDSDERYVLAAKGSNDGLWDWKIPSDKIYFSPRWKQMLGYTDDDEIGSEPGEWFSRIHPGDLQRVKAEIAERRRDAPEVFACEYRILQKSGLYIWVLCRGIAVCGPKNIVRMAGSQTDITEGKVVDSLTGLRNRLYFIDKIESCLNACEGAAHPFAVLFLDLDRFKVVNDSLGHDAGDQLLIEVSTRLQLSLRASDIVSRNTIPSVIARFGGDEFAILVHDAGNVQAASAVAERILKQLAPPSALRVLLCS